MSSDGVSSLRAERCIMDFFCFWELLINQQPMFSKANSHLFHVSQRIWSFAASISFFFGKSASCESLSFMTVKYEFGVTSFREKTFVGS